MAGPAPIRLPYPELVRLQRIAAQARRAVRPVRSRHDPARSSVGQARAPADLFGRRDPGVSRDRGPVRAAASADDGPCRRPAEAGRARLAGAGGLDAMPKAEDAGRAAALPRQRRPAAPARPLSGHHGAIPCRAVDGSGIGCGAKAPSEWFASKPLPGDRWHAHTHGGARRRVRPKVHRAVDETTPEVRAAGLTGSGVGPSRQGPSRRIASRSPAHCPVGHACMPDRGQWMGPCGPACPAGSPRAGGLDSPVVRGRILPKF